MCECGCANFQADYQFPGPEGFVYALQIYTPCANCSTPLGVIVHRFTAAEAERWGLEHVPPMTFDGSAEMADAYIALLGPRALKKRMAAFAKGVGPDVYDGDGLVEDAADECLVEAIHDTLNERKKR